MHNRTANQYPQFATVSQDSKAPLTEGYLRSALSQENLQSTRYTPWASISMKYLTQQPHPGVGRFGPPTLIDNPVTASSRTNPNENPHLSAAAQLRIRHNAPPPWLHKNDSPERSKSVSTLTSSPAATQRKTFQSRVRRDNPVQTPSAKSPILTRSTFSSGRSGVNGSPPVPVDAGSAGYNRAHFYSPVDDFKNPQSTPAPSNVTSANLQQTVPNTSARTVQTQPIIDSHSQSRWFTPPPDSSVTGGSRPNLANSDNSTLRKGISVENVRASSASPIRYGNPPSFHSLSRTARPALVTAGSLDLNDSGGNVSRSDNRSISCSLVKIPEKMPEIRENVIAPPSGEPEAYISLQGEFRPRKIAFSPYQSSGRIVPDPSTPEGGRVMNPFKTGVVSKVSKSVSWDCNMASLWENQRPFPKENDRLSQLKIVQKRKEQFERGAVDHVGPLKLYHAQAYKRELDKVGSANTGHVLAKAACFEGSGTASRRSSMSSASTESDWPTSGALSAQGLDSVFESRTPSSGQLTPVESSPYSPRASLPSYSDALPYRNGWHANQSGKSPLRQPSFIAAVTGDRRNGHIHRHSAAVSESFGYHDPIQTPPSVQMSHVGRPLGRDQSSSTLVVVSPSVDVNGNQVPEDPDGEDRLARRSSYILATAAQNEASGCRMEELNGSARNEDEMRPPGTDPSRNQRPESFAGSGSPAKTQSTGSSSGPHSPQPRKSKAASLPSTAIRVSSDPMVSVAAPFNGSSISGPGTAPSSSSVPSPSPLTTSSKGWRGKVPPELVRRFGPLWHKQSRSEEGKKSGERGWRHFWALLERQILYLCKDKPKVEQESYKVPHDTVEIPVAGCISDITYEYPKRKNVFRVTTTKQEEHLFQAEDAPSMLSWLEAIHQSSGVEDEQNDDGMSSSMALIIKRYEAAQAGSSTSPSTKQRRGPGFLRRSDGGAPSSHDETSPKVDHHHHHVEKKGESSGSGGPLRRLRKVRKSGSCPVATPRDDGQSNDTEGGMFGRNLEDIPTSGEEDYVPLLVQLCVKVLECHGLDTVGVYRIPGNSAAVNTLMSSLNKGFEHVDFKDPRWRDVNVVSSLLKAFFRKLADPLLTNKLYTNFIEANRVDDHEARLLRFKELINLLPKIYYETLKYLMLHLQKVVAHSNVNKMEARNLALMFGPSLVRPSDDSMTTMVTHMSDQCKIVETLIVNSSWLFLSEEGSSAPPPSVDESVSAKSSTTTSFSDMSDLLKRVSRTEKDLEETKDNIVKSIKNVRRGSKPKIDPNLLPELIGENTDAASRQTGPDTAGTFSERNIDEEIALRTGQIGENSGITSPEQDQQYTGTPSTETDASMHEREDLSPDLTLEELRLKREADLFTARRIFISGSDAATDSSLLIPPPYPEECDPTKDHSNVPPRSPLIKMDPENLDDVLSPETRERVRQFQAESRFALQPPATGPSSSESTQSTRLPEQISVGPGRDKTQAQAIECSSTSPHCRLPVQPGAAACCSGEGSWIGDATSVRSACSTTSSTIGCDTSMTSSATDPVPSLDAAFHQSVSDSVTPHTHLKFSSPLTTSSYHVPLMRSGSAGAPLSDYSSSASPTTPHLPKRIPATSTVSQHTLTSGAYLSGSDSSASLLPSSHGASKLRDQAAPMTSSVDSGVLLGSEVTDRSSVSSASYCGLDDSSGKTVTSADASIKCEEKSSRRYVGSHSSVGIPRSATSQKQIPPSTDADCTFCSTKLLDRPWYEIDEDLLDEISTVSGQIRDSNGKADSEPPLSSCSNVDQNQNHLAGTVSAKAGASSSSSIASFAKGFSGGGSRISQKIKFRSRGQPPSSADKRKESRRHTLSNLTDIESIKSLLFGNSSNSSSNTSSQQSTDRTARDGATLIANETGNPGIRGGGKNQSSIASGAIGSRKSGPFERAGSMKIFRRERSSSRTPGRIKSWFKESFRKSSPDLSEDHAESEPAESRSTAGGCATSEPGEKEAH